MPLEDAEGLWGPSLVQGADVQRNISEVAWSSLPDRQRGTVLTICLLEGWQWVTVCASCPYSRLHVSAWEPHTILGRDVLATWFNLVSFSRCHMEWALLQALVRLCGLMRAMPGCLVLSPAWPPTSCVTLVRSLASQ